MKRSNLAPYAAALVQSTIRNRHPAMLCADGSELKAVEKRIRTSEFRVGNEH